jgi:hypothetical protein
MSDVEGAKKRVHQLLLSGDNTLKNRDDPQSRDRARAKFAEAGAVAREAGLPSELLGIIDRRLELLDGAGAP